MSLARTAHWLLSSPRSAERGEPGTLDPRPHLQPMLADGTPCTLAAPPGTIGGRPLRWPSAPPTFGSNRAAWLDG